MPSAAPRTRQAVGTGAFPSCPRCSLPLRSRRGVHHSNYLLVGFNPKSVNSALSRSPRYPVHRHMTAFFWSWQPAAFPTPALRPATPTPNDEKIYIKDDSILSPRGIDAAARARLRLPAFFRARHRRTGTPLGFGSAPTQILQKTSHDGGSGSA